MSGMDPNNEAACFAKAATTFDDRCHLAILLLIVTDHFREYILADKPCRRKCNPREKYMMNDMG